MLSQTYSLDSVYTEFFSVASVYFYWSGECRRIQIYHYITRILTILVLRGKTTIWCKLSSAGVPLHIDKRSTFGNCLPGTERNSRVRKIYAAVFQTFTLRRASSSCPIHRTHQRKKFTRLQRNPSAATIDDSTRQAIPRNFRGER